eukprot:scaffold3638_cov92-Amphora_coffeaeformis.AAC.1
MAAVRQRSFGGGGLVARTAGRDAITVQQHGRLEGELEGCEGLSSAGAGGNGEGEGPGDGEGKGRQEWQGVDGNIDVDWRGR